MATFVVLFGILAGHTLIETARDAMFLARLPATELPLTYLAIAAISLVASQFAGRRSSRALGLWLLWATAITVGLWWVARPQPAGTDVWVFYAIYVWSGVFISIAIVQYWILLGQVFSLEQAKRLYAPIGAGSVLGAIVGAAVATAMVQSLPPRHLLLAGAGCFLVSAVVPLLVLRGLKPVSETALARPLALPFAVKRVFEDPYVARLAGLVAVSTVVFTLVDYLFKAQVAAAVPASELAETFALIYVVLNAMALLAQLFLTGWLLRVIGVQRVLWILPGLLLGGALFLAFGGAIYAAIWLKGADGTLKHSLYRTASEVLFLPIADRLRPNAKRFIDMVGRRAAQALASVLILGVVYTGGGDLGLAVITAVACIVWIVMAWRLKPHYLGIVRDKLKRGTLASDKVVVDKLDVSALEALMAALNSADDAEVRTAMELLAQTKRAHLIPGLILHHPSRAIVTRALDLFAECHRIDHLPIVERLWSSPDPHIRAAVLRSHPTLVRRVEALDDRSPLVFATALVQLVASGGSDAAQAQEELDRLVEQGGPREYIGLAEAISADPGPQFVPLLLRLSEHPSVQVQIAVCQAMAELPDPAFIPYLLGRLAHRAGRSQARDALRTIGPEALEALAGAMAHGELPFSLRRHLPRAISAFGDARAGEILLSRLLEEPSGMIRYRILRSLERMRAVHRDMALDEAALDHALTRTLDAGYTLLQWRVALERAGEETRTVGQALMVELIADKETHAIERLLRLLNLWHRDEDFEQIYRGLRSANTVVAASSLELLANVVRAPHTEAVVGLVSGLVGNTPDLERLAAAPPTEHALPKKASYEALLMGILASPSDSLRALAAYHIGELGWNQAAPELRLILETVPPDSFAAEAIGHALERLGADPRERITVRGPLVPAPEDGSASSDGEVDAASRRRPMNG